MINRYYHKPEGMVLDIAQSSSNVHGEWVRLEEVLSVIDRRIEEAKRNIRECQNHGWSVKEIAEYTMVKEELESLKAELKGSDTKKLSLCKGMHIDCPTCHGKKEWVDIESRTITLCPDCNDVSKALRDTINNEIEQVKKESERLKKIIDQTEQKIVYNILKKSV